MNSAAALGTASGGTPGELRDIFVSGYGDGISSSLSATSGLRLAHLAPNCGGRVKREKNNPDDCFTVCVVERSHEVDVRHDGRLVRSGRMAVGAVCFADPARRTETVTTGQLEVLFLLLPIRLVMAVCEGGDLAMNGDAGIGFINRHGRVDAKLLALAREAHGEAISPGPFSRLRGDLIGQQIVIQLLQHHSTLADTLARGSVGRARGGLSPGQLRRACDIMDASLEDEVTLTMLATVVGCSPTHFSRAFKQSTGMAPFAWLLHRRIERAQELLLAGTLSIAEIALAVGFSAQPQFTTAFRRVIGSTPAAWRRSRCN